MTAYQLHGRLPTPSSQPVAHRQSVPQSGGKTSLVVICGRKKNKKLGQHVQSNAIKPPRITPETSQAVGGVAKYIKLVRHQEALEARGSAQVVRKKFRKPKKTKEEILEEKQQTKSTQMTKELSTGIRDLFGTYSRQNSPVLMVDGYNVLFKLIDKEARRCSGLNLEEQREVLEDDLLLFSMSRGVRVTIVYDGQGHSSGNGIARYEQMNGMDIIFCSGIEADVGILVEIDRLLAAGSKSILVATSDHELRNSCFHPPTCFVMSSDSLLREINQCKLNVRRIVEESQRKQATSFLGKAVEGDTFSELLRLRNKLEAERNLI